jgi:two-component system phosphate regulon sensor histidine kinase PhoR
MGRKRLIWQLYPSYLAVTLVALVAVGWYSSDAFRRFYREQTRTELETLAHIAAEQISGTLRLKEMAQVDNLCKRLGQASAPRTRITVILPSGKVVGDSDTDPAEMEDHSDRPEIIAALAKGLGWSLRSSPTLGRNMMYVAIPIKEQDAAMAVVRVAVPATAIEQALKDIYVKIFWGGLAAAVCAAGLSFVISRRISQPIVQMQQIAQGFAQGQFNLRVPIPSSVELAALAKALNKMATQLHDRIITITNQCNQLQAVLSSMVEGVVAVDGQGRIVSINKAAATLLNIDPLQAQGRNVEEVIRNVDLAEFIKKTLNSEQLTEADILLLTEGNHFFQLHGASLPAPASPDANRGAGPGDTSGSPQDSLRRSGAVIVLNDMTRMRRLENIRRDFVANVSHELRTPVTSIQGFVEALLEGAMKEPQLADRYLKIIAKHADRLNAIIADLLSLSRLEEDSQSRRISFEKVLIKPVLQAAIELSTVQAARKGIGIKLSCQEDVEAQINSTLLEQALLNLIDNAIKYTEPGGLVCVTAQQEGADPPRLAAQDSSGGQAGLVRHQSGGRAGIAISVKDKGCGIEKAHLERIFERFYVVDKGRSRRLGGTGLGLAIVKHIAGVHGGSVTVESSPGVGSTFTIHLPVG